VFELIFPDTDPGIANGDRCCTVGSNRCMQVHVALGRELDGVRDQVFHDALELHPVGAHANVSVGRLSLQTQHLHLG